MGEVEINHDRGIISILSHIYTYGLAANEELTERIRFEIETMWNAPQGTIVYRNESYKVVFIISATHDKNISELEVLQNTNPRNNYFRIEEYVAGNISFVDGLSCNTGFFKLENLYEGSTTAAHEYGHTLGLNHPHDTDLRGKGRPGIMYPRGTLVDPEFQYDPLKSAGETGGTLHPRFREVQVQDIRNLNLHRLDFNRNMVVLGDFTNVYHWPHLI
jgi:hypothetical protein